MVSMQRAAPLPVAKDKRPSMPCRPKNNFISGLNPNMKWKRRILHSGTP